MMPVPGRCQALGDEDVTQGFAIAHYGAQLAAILVLVTITARDDLERSFVEKINKSMGGLYSACQLVGAFVIVTSGASISTSRILVLSIQIVSPSTTQVTRITPLHRPMFVVTSSGARTLCC
jgi:hypothetical protein